MNRAQVDVGDFDVTKVTLDERQCLADTDDARGVEIAFFDRRAQHVELVEGALRAVLRSQELLGSSRRRSSQIVLVVP